jgi:hypothetical protein
MNYCFQTTTTCGLRTPSSFISRMAADFSNRSLSVEESDNLNNGQNNDFMSIKNEDEILNGNFHNGNGHDSSLSENGCANNGTENGNDLDTNVSTSDRRKLFENSSPPNDNTNGSVSPGARQARVTVAERLKMYQQTSNGAPQEDFNNEEKLIEQSEQPPSRLPMSNSNHGNLASIIAKERECCPAPIAKPERKFTPPKSEPMPKSFENVTTSGTNKSSAPKRIVTVFGKNIVLNSLKKQIIFYNTFFS